MTSNGGTADCANTREAIADAILERRTLEGAAARHLSGCAACRGYQLESERIWNDLGELSLPVPEAAARERFAAAVRAAASPPKAARRVTAGLLAAGIAFGALIGYGAARLSANRAAAPDSVPRFLLLLYDTSATTQAMTQRDMREVIAEYSAWGRRLREAGQLVSAEKLTDTPPDWLGGTVATANGEQIGGFFLIRAPTLAEARRIAESCPHLKYGGRIELRPIQPT